MARYEISNIPGAIDFECSSDFVRRTVQNAKNLIMCRRGEIPYDRQRGLDPAVADLPLPELREAILPELDRVLLWEPDAEVVDASVTLEDGETIIRAVIEVADE